MRNQMLIGALVVGFGAFGCGIGGDPAVEDDTESGSCAIHNVPYVVEVIPVQYGLQRGPQLTEAQRKWQEQEWAAWNEGFRYSHLANKAGGCVVREAKSAKVSYCPECRKADDAWHAIHGQLPPAEKPN